MSAPGGAPTAAARRPAWERLPLLVLGFVALFAGIGAGLARLGWAMPEVAAGAAAWHGPLMICGFFGVVIGLERAVAIGRWWAYGAPLLAGLGTAAALHGHVAATPVLTLAASAVLLAASLHVLWRQREGFMFTIALAAGCWTVGTALWAAGWAVHEVVGWWIGFLVLTIAGERLELSRFMPPSRRATQLFAAIVAFYLIRDFAAVRMLPLPSVAAMVLMTFISLAVGWWLGGPDKATRQTLALGTSVEFAGLALLITTLSFPGTLASITVVAFGLIMILINTTAALVWRRRDARAAQAPALLPQPAAAPGGAAGEAGGW